ncbi:MAG: alkaline phosphatase family protein, partial [Blastocatellia bacterium]
MAGLQNKIKHVVVLMLENRSFDCVLGRLYVGRSDFNGLTGDESNPLTGGTG